MFIENSPFLLYGLLTQRFFPSPQLFSLHFFLFGVKLFFFNIRIGRWELLAVAHLTPGRPVMPLK